ncbi:MAG: SUMF1/EgtB/PvdO family nonheme iron enzyme [Pseudomonadota bacterium]
MPLTGISDESGKAYKVFVSSTYLDNKERRKAVQDAITMAGMVWHGMEIFPASTERTVKECLRYAKEADLLVGIIAWRYGWEPNGEKSITEMEYDAAKERLMFQLDPTLPVNPEKDFDPGPDRWKKQEKIEAFKRRFSEDQMPAYFNETTLQAKVLHSLNEWRRRREQAPPGEEKEASKTRQRAARDAVLDPDILDYRIRAESLFGFLPVAGFATQIRIPIDIEEIYVPLRAVLDLRGVAEETFKDAAHAEKSLRGTEQGLEFPLPEAFRQSEMRKQKGLVILGDPGSGKTTHLKRILLGCLRNGAETLGLPADMLPGFLPLRELKDAHQDLDSFIRDQLTAGHLKTPKGFGMRLLKRGRLLLLLDGLDEVADLDRREEVAGWIIHALPSYPDCRFVVTCRFAGYSQTVRMSEQFIEMHIRPFTGDQSERFINNWYSIVERGLSKDPEQAEGIALEKAHDLIKRLKEPDFRARRVFELTRNPLLLTNICLVHRHRGSLPQKRARLYEECIDVLLEHWRVAKGLPVEMTAQAGRKALQPAALWMHREEGRTQAKAEELAPHIEPALKTVKWTRGSGADFLRTIRDESGLLTGWDQDHYGFMHLGFQEYLAAREIRRKYFEDEKILRELAAHFGESWWEEVGLLLLALEDDPSLFTPYMRELIKQPAFIRYPNLIEACLDDAAEVSIDPFMELFRVEPGKVKDLWERQFVALKIIDRLNPGAVEGLEQNIIGHPFSEIRRWAEERFGKRAEDMLTIKEADYELVRIPGGLFMMGSSKSEEGRYDDEGPVHRVKVQDFFMGKYPVTNEQYGKFLKANPKAPEPDYWADRKYNQPRQPVVGVSWDDAQRFAQWAGLKLPSEAEWEYACRAGTTTRYYSGDSEDDLKKVGWYAGNSGSELHSVGEKTANDFGLYDMHGNILEWVEDDWHDSYKGAPDDGSAWVGKKRGSIRVFRGGSWGVDAHYCRSAYRSSDSPVFRRVFLGFRLSRSLNP